MGTPKTLKQAIMNGLLEATKKASWNATQTQRFEKMDVENRKLVAEELQVKQLEIIETHVLDFFRQKFGVAYLEIEHWFEDRSYKDPAGIIRELAEATGVAKKDA